MTIEPLQEEFPWTDGPPRSPGLHLMEIVHDIALTAGIGGKYTDDGSDHRLQFEKGYLWEVLLSLAFAEKAAVRPPEIVVDGIACSPDGISNEGFDPIVEEYKCTACSSAHTPDENIEWMMQVKGYCYVVGAAVCIFRILYLNGDYRSDRSPQYRVYKLEFGITELEENWTMIVNHARARGWLKEGNQ